MGKPKHSIGLDEAREAVYVDFEGNVNEAPSILGVRHGDTTVQYVIEEQLASFATLSNPKYDVKAASLDGALAQLRQLAEGRLVAGFTTHEVNVVSSFCENADLRSWFTTTYVNVKKPIDRWVRGQVASGALPAVEDRSLLTYMTAAGISYKPGCGPGIVGPGLTRLRDQVARHGTATAISKGSKNHWWRILSHNATDLGATQELTMRALGGDQ